MVAPQLSFCKISSIIDIIFDFILQKKKKKNCKNFFFEKKIRNGSRSGLFNSLQVASSCSCIKIGYNSKLKLSTQKQEKKRKKNSNQDVPIQKRSKQMPSNVILDSSASAQKRSFTRSERRRRRKKKTYEGVFVGVRNPVESFDC